MGFSTFFSVKSSFSHILNQNKSAFPRALRLYLSATSGFPSVVCSGWRLLKGGKNGELAADLMLLWTLIFPACLLRFTFQCSQIATTRIQSRFYNCISWERKDRMCLFHLITYSNTQKIKYDLSFCKGPSSQNYGFSSSHVQMWELNYKESWVLKNWCFWTMVLEKTLESPFGL